MNNITTSKVNFTQLSDMCGVKREIIDKIYSKFISLMSKGIQSGRQVLVTVHKVAEITIINN